MEIIELFRYNPTSVKTVQLYSLPAYAGQGYMIEDDTAETIDLNEYLVEHPLTTFFAHVHGETLTDAGIDDGDILVIDSALEPKNGKIVLVGLNGDLTVKIYRNIEGEEFLQLKDDHFLPLKIEPYLEYEIIGVVTKVIHSIK